MEDDATDTEGSSDAARAALGRLSSQPPADAETSQPAERRADVSEQGKTPTRSASRTKDAETSQPAERPTDSPWHGQIPNHIRIRATLDEEEVRAFIKSQKYIALDTEGKPATVVQFGNCHTKIMITTKEVFKRSMRGMCGAKIFFMWDMSNDRPWELCIKWPHKRVDVQPLVDRTLGPYPLGNRWGLCPAYNAFFRTKHKKDLDIVKSDWTRWPLSDDQQRYAAMDVNATFKIAQRISLHNLRNV
jgi:hypothetical protein